MKKIRMTKDRKKIISLENKVVELEKALATELENTQRSERNLSYQKECVSAEREKLKKYESKEVYNKALGDYQETENFKAIRKAHEELFQVKSIETDTKILHRAIGAAQGILSAAINYCQTNLYPVENPLPSDTRNRCY